MGTRCVTPCMRHRCKVRDQAPQEPAQPHRFSTTLLADPVHTVVPVATAHQGQPVGAHGQAAVHGECRMFVHRCLLGAGGGLVVSILSTRRYDTAFNKCHLFVEQRRVVSGIQVMRAGMYQPQTVVRKMGSHTHACWRVPPMLNIAFDKLARRIENDLLTQNVWRRPGQGHGILQLVPKPGGTARLIKTRLGPQTARERLVKQPAVHQHVEQRVRGLDCGGSQQRGPVGAHLRESTSGRHSQSHADQRPSLLGIGCIPQQESSFC